MGWSVFRLQGNCDSHEEAAFNQMCVQRLPAQNTFALAIAHRSSCVWQTSARGQPVDEVWRAPWPRVELGVVHLCAETTEPTMLPTRSSECPASPRSRSRNILIRHTPDAEPMARTQAAGDERQMRISVDCTVEREVHWANCRTVSDTGLTPDFSAQEKGGAPTPHRFVINVGNDDQASVRLCVAPANLTLLLASLSLSLSSGAVESVCRVPARHVKVAECHRQGQTAALAAG